jgi:serine/threonine protein kinase
LLSDLAGQIMRDVLGEVVGNYRVTAKLAEGGMGTVYRAEHSLLGKTAAVKVLLPELSNNREIVNRFFTEARATTAIRHPGIVEIYDFGYLASGAAYIVMELLDGEPLSLVLVARGRLTEQEALLHTRGIASALAAAHAQSIVHRDLKPDNVFLVRDPDMAGGVRPKLLDFGIAKVAEAQRAGGASKTRTGTVMGTPTYMSPEQCRGVGEVDHRADLYAVGCILYEMLVGRPPFASEGIGELLAMHLYMAPTPPSNVGVAVSPATERLVLQLLQKRPEDRVQSAAELARSLGQGSLPGISNHGMPTIAAFGVPTPPPLVPMPTPAPAPAHVTGTGPALRTPTTLSAATSSGAIGREVAAAPRRSARGFLYVGLGVVLAGGAAVALALSGGGEAPASSAASASTPPSPPSTPPQSAPPLPTTASESPMPTAAAAEPSPAAPTPPTPAKTAPAKPAAVAPATAAAAPTAAAPTTPAKRTTTYQGNKPDAKPTRGRSGPSSASVDRGD